MAVVGFHLVTISAGSVWWQFVGFGLVHPVVGVAFALVAVVGFCFIWCESITDWPNIGLWKSRNMTCFRPI